MILPVAREKQRLDQVFSLVAILPKDEEVLSHWARYLCVLTSGFLENSLRTLLQFYTEKHANKTVADFVLSEVKHITNLNEDKIVQLLGSFSTTWRDTFLSLRSPEQKDAIDSVVANRHLIAHGKQVGISFVQIKEYYGSISKVVKILDEECINK